MTCSPAPGGAFLGLRRLASWASWSCGLLGGRYGMSAKHTKKQIENIIQSLCVLIVDDNQYMRKMVRNLLVNCGIKDIYEAAEGIAALDFEPHHGARCRHPPDWEMPMLSGPELVRIVRSPGVFPMPDIPIIIDRRLRALARRRGGAARGQPISDQAGLGKSAL